MHEYSVALLISGDPMEENYISRKLDLKPTVFRKKGETLSATKQRIESTWSFNVAPNSENPVWESLDEGLKYLAARLLPLKDGLAELQSRYCTDAYCGHFASGFGGGPFISSETLRLLADLRLSLIIKTYWNQDEDEREPTMSKYRV